MNKKLIIGILGLFLLAAIPAVSASYYDYHPYGYNDYYDYSKTVHSNPWGKTVEIRKDTPYSSSYYYKTSEYTNYRQAYNYWGYYPDSHYDYSYHPYYYQNNKYYDYSKGYWHWRY